MSQAGQPSINTQRAAGPLAALFVLALLAAWPRSADAATVGCPPNPLLSEEITRAASVLVGSVRSISDAPEVPGSFVAAVRVEEVWRGPPLTPIVFVQVDPAAGAPKISLEPGGRYLVIAEPVPGAVNADGTVGELSIPPCSATRPLTSDLVALRPSDARVMPGFETTDVPSTAGPDWQRAVSPWMWMVAALLVLVTSGVVLLRRRTAGGGGWLPWATGGGALMAVVAAVALTLLLPSDPISTANSPEPSIANTRSAAPSGTDSIVEAEDPTLVVRLQEFTETGPGRVVSLHADGRLIASAVQNDFLVLRVQRLTPDGVALVRDQIAATGLFGVEAPLSARYQPVLLPGAQLGARGGYGERLTVGRGGSTVTVDFSPIFGTEAALFEPSPEIDRLQALADRLLAPGDWLPVTAWAAPEPRLYEAARFRVTAIEHGAGMPRPSLTLRDLSWPISTSFADLPAARDPGGRLVRCAAFTRDEAVDFLGSLSAALNDPGLTLAAARISMPIFEEESAIGHDLTIEALFPDEAGCDEPQPVAAGVTLTAGAIGLVRVDDLRVRESPGSEARVIDAFQAGERVTVGAGPVTVGGLDWYHVRQGPGDRGGWVSAGPPDADPWLVPVGNGAIAFLQGGFGAGEVTPSVQRMDADGSNLASMADGYPAAWSSDGRLIAISLPPTGAGDTWRIAVAKADGSGLRVLVDGEDPVWSPDATTIAFVRHAESGPTIHLIGADGAGLRELTNGAGPAWSPDGSRLAFLRAEPVDPPQGEGVFVTAEALWLVDLRDGEVTRLTDDDLFEGSAGRPSWAPDGTQIAFGSNRLVGADRMHPRELDGGATWVGGMTPWSPDGEDLAIVTEAGLQLQSVDTGARRTILPLARPTGLQVTWSPDGRFLAYTGGIDEPMIFVIGTDGGEPLQIGPPDAQLPIWQPLVEHFLD